MPHRNIRIDRETSLQPIAPQYEAGARRARVLTIGLLVYPFHYDSMSKEVPLKTVVRILRQQELSCHG